MQRLEQLESIVRVRSSPSRLCLVKMLNSGCCLMVPDLQNTCPWKCALGQHTEADATKFQAGQAPPPAGSKTWHLHCLALPASLCPGFVGMNDYGDCGILLHSFREPLSVGDGRTMGHAQREALNLEWSWPQGKILCATGRRAEWERNPDASIMSSKCLTWNHRMHALLGLMWIWSFFLGPCSSLVGRNVYSMPLYVKSNVCVCCLNKYVQVCTCVQMDAEVIWEWVSCIENAFTWWTMFPVHVTCSLLM